MTRITSLSPLTQYFKDMPMQCVLLQMNPYSDTSFFEFFLVLAARLWLCISGQGEDLVIASDEIQLVVLVGVALCCSLLGVFLVLRRMTMLANALSHTILLGIVFTFLMTQGLSAADHTSYIPLNFTTLVIAAMLTGIITTFLTQFLVASIRLQEDASTGLVFTALFALGIILVTLLTRNAHIGTEAVMGNADALQLYDGKLIWLLFAFNLLIIGLFFKEYIITTFDPPLAIALGITPTLFSYLLMVQVSGTVIGAFRAVGVLMVLALLTGPPLIARQLCCRIKSLCWISMAIGAFCAIVGVALARHLLSVAGLAFSTAGLVVCVLAALFLLTILRPVRK